MAGSLKLSQDTAADVPRAPSPDTTITLAVENMSCGGCITTVERALLCVPGVVTARANLSARRVTVDLASDLAGQVGTDQLVGALEGVGYRAAELLADTGDAAHLARDADLTRRLGVAGFAAMNIMLLSVSVWSGQGGDMDHSLQSLFHWLSALIALPSVAYAGQPFFRSAVGALKVGRLNMDVPISLGVILATGMSLFQTVRGTGHVYFDAAVMLLAFLLIGRLLDQQMRTRASGAAANLLGLRVASASVLDADGSVSRVSVRRLEPGMRIIAAAGERLAADGFVRAGESEIDESLITGETAPRHVKAGSQVYAGTVNLVQSLTVEVTARDENSLLADIARLMAAAEQSKGLYVRLADRAARLYAPAVHVLGLATFVGWMLTGHGWEAALTAAIAVLIITCPCALALAVPAVQVAAASRLYSKGVIVKAADGLERMTEVDTIVFDKTGTVTTGEPQVLNAETVSDEVLLAAASLAVQSRHPYARAVVAAARARGLSPAAGAAATEVSGSGLVRATPEGEERLGSSAWAGGGRSGGRGAEVWYKPAAGEAVVFRMADLVREDAAEVVRQLKGAGYAIELLSGDRPGVVGGVARECGIDIWSAAQRPDQKIARLSTLKSEGHKVLMVGDGLNDAPALAAAHASLSPSTAADISQTAADGIVQGAKLAPIVEVLMVAQASRRMALQNFALAIGYNILFVPLAVAGLVTPLIAAVAMSASSVTVTANAVRLRTMRLELRR
jgi:Cu2+-exporting ATPase